MRLCYSFFTVLFIFFSCHKKTQPVDPDTIFHPINQYLKASFNFKPGSYWIYTTPSGLDSVYLTDYATRFDTVKSCCRANTLDVFEVIEYGLSNQTASNALTYNYLLIQLKDNTITNNLSSALSVNYNYTSEICTTENFIGATRQCQIYKDTVNLANGNQYLDATLFINEYDFQAHSGPMVPVRTKTILLPVKGIISYKSSGAFARDLELLRSMVIQ